MALVSKDVVEKKIFIAAPSKRGSYFLLEKFFFINSITDYLF